MNPNNPKLNEITPREMSSQDIERWLRSVQADLEEPGVFVPEMNAIRWDWEDEKNANKPKFAFICPVGYRGMIANLGVNILYEEMNLYRNQICERIYFPYPKLFKRLVQNRIPLFTSESYHQAKDFDVLGISSYYPLQFLGFPQLIKLCGMEPYSKDRVETDPIIMFGGVAAFNPAPVADFVDVVNLGDGEKVLADAVDLIKKLKDEGKSKYEILVELQKQIPGTYVPCLYKEEYYPADDPKHPNQFKAHVPLRDDIPTRIKKYTCEIKYVRPVSKIIQPNSLGDDMSSGAVEITRGCGHKCSFCEGSYRSMPYRERDLEDIYKAIDQTLLDSGSASLTPYAFNLSDHHRIFDILSYAMTKWPTRIGMSSQHINHFSEQMADMALMTGTRSITIALESADPVMRRRIGKTLSDETVEEKLRLIIRKGFTNIKVYMISNLPYEDDESLHEIENFSRKLIRWQIEEQSPIFPSKEAAHEYVSRPEFDAEIDKFAESCKQAFRSKTKIVPEGEEYWNLHLKYKLITRIKFSYTSFNGKAHTPMQWAQVLPIDEEGFPSIRRDMHTIFDVIQACGHSFRMSGDLEISTLNQVLSYADRRFAPVLVDICNDDRFNYKGTLVAGSNNTMRDFADVMAKHGFDFNFFYREKELDEAFPWDFINMGVTKKFLEKRWLMYKNAEDDIRCQEQCTHCGGCTKVSRELFKRYWEEGLEEKKSLYKVIPILKRENVCKVRFRFSIRPEYRWLYAFNKKNWLRRSFYRAGIPVKTVFALVSDGVEFNNFCYGVDYGEVWCYSKNFPKSDLVKLLNDTFDEQEPPIIFEDVTVGTSTSQFRTDVGKISYSVQIPSKTYTKARLEEAIFRINRSDSVTIRQKVASTVERDTTETITIEIKDRYYNLFCVSGDGFSTIYFQLDYGLNPYSFLTTLLSTSLSRCRRYPIMVHEVFAKEQEDSFDMFAEICEDCGEVIERNIFDEPVNEHYCSKCAILHDKQELVVNLDADDDDVDDTDLDNFDTSFLEEEDMEEMNEEHQAID